MIAAAAAATAVCVLATAALVIVERRGSIAGRDWWKPLASAAFLVVPLVGGALGAGTADSTVARYVVAGLCLGAIGDLALMVEDDRGFLGGLVAFLLGHVAYVMAFTQVVPLGAWFAGPMPVVIVLVAAIAAIILRWLWSRLGSLRYPVIAYVAVISTMLVGGVAASLRGDGSALGDGARGLLTAGAVAFFASDLAVARERFMGRDPWNRTIGLPVYYGAQLLFAWAIIP